MRDLIEYAARCLVDEPEAVEVEERPGASTVYELSVAPGDLGKVIGRQGRTAKALRTLLAARAEVEGKRATLEILD
ncbi:KH domain-containing protein [Vulgatibacter sp.]|uniref:KH domain-containing protein n=1 Tax=Vulgatibacter sp. TaxID=1971226 RepID=UPI00356B0EA5